MDMIEKNPRNSKYSLELDEFGDEGIVAIPNSLDSLKQITTVSHPTLTFNGQVQLSGSGTNTYTID